MGTKRDRIARTALARVDSHQRRQLISVARKTIYQQNYDVDSAGIERMLKPQSFVPTSVCNYLLINAFTSLSILRRMPFLIDFLNSV
jgi:hypothetical protein